MQQDNKKYDYIIIGAGIIGLTIAYRLLQRANSDGISLAILEKEHDVALHASGRNSGVLHAGFYYYADSLKARFTIDGNKEMKKFCRENEIYVNESKKVVVTSGEEELDGLYELEKRGKINGVDVEIISEGDLHKIDDNVRTFKKALYSPTTASVDPVDVCNKLKEKIQLFKNSVVDFRLGEGYLRKVGQNKIKTSNNEIIIAVKKIINTAGLYADRIAKDFNFSKDMTIIPFKGIYLKYTNAENPVKINVYPVPNLKNPFLGVHYTVTSKNEIKIGPTSIPAFWRENYNFYENFKLDELIEILFWESKLFLFNSFNFRDLAIDEVKKYNRNYFVGLAEKMVKSIDPSGFNKWIEPGIRAQLLDKKTNELVQDFVVEGDDKSVHVLNAVSPAFTCSFPFADYVIEKYVM